MQDLANAASNSSIDLHISIFITNPNLVGEEPELPNLPNCDTYTLRPRMYNILAELITPPTPESESIAAESSSGKLKWIGLGGGVGVSAAGPNSLIRDVKNAVATFALTAGTKLGGVELHTESFAI